MKAWIFIIVLAATPAAWAAQQGHDHAGATQEANTFYCPMHPQIQQDKPGTCPICHMDLVALDQDAPGSEDMPGALKGLAPLKLSSFKEQLIGLKTEKVSKKKMHRSIDTVGRFGGGEGNFAASAIGFTSQQKGASQSRYVIADVFALDIPYVKKGQQAEVMGFAANSPVFKGKVARVYPYDGTQSRVRRVRIDLHDAPDNEQFGNVRIKVESSPGVALPSSAVINTGSRRYVFVKDEDGRLLPREVSLGFLGEEYWEVKEGVMAGEEVVVGATFLVDADSQLKAVLHGVKAPAGHQH